MPTQVTWYRVLRKYAKMENLWLYFTGSDGGWVTNCRSLMTSARIPREARAHLPVIPRVPVRLSSLRASGCIWFNFYTRYLRPAWPTWTIYGVINRITLYVCARSYDTYLPIYYYNIMRVYGTRRARASVRPSARTRSNLLSFSVFFFYFLIFFFRFFPTVFRLCVCFFRPVDFSVMQMRPAPIICLKNFFRTGKKSLTLLIHDDVDKETFKTVGSGLVFYFFFPPPRYY